MTNDLYVIIDGRKLPIYPVPTTVSNEEADYENEQD